MQSIPHREADPAISQSHGRAGADDLDRDCFDHHQIIRAFDRGDKTVSGLIDPIDYPGQIASQVLLGEITDK
jgi:hypothetical protein